MHGPESLQRNTLPSLNKSLQVVSSNVSTSTLANSGLWSVSHLLTDVQLTDLTDGHFSSFHPWGTQVVAVMITMFQPLSSPGNP